VEGSALTRRHPGSLHWAASCPNSHHLRSRVRSSASGSGSTSSWTVVKFCSRKLEMCSAWRAKSIAG
jgi:hypothetical protein